MRLGLLVAACSVLLSACTIGIVQLSELTADVSPLATPEPSLSWRITTVDKEVGTAIAMVLDRHGYPHFAYESAQNDLLYVRWDGEDWKKENVTSMELGGDVLLTLDSDDNPHIVFSGCNPFTCISHYTRRTEQKWNIVDLSALVSNVALQVDAAGTLHMSYIYGNMQGQLALHYAYWDENTWVTQTLDSDIEYVQHLQLRLDREGNPHIGYLGQSGLTYTYWTGQEWRTWTVDNTRKTGEGHALALDREGYAHLSYYESEDATLKYAAWDGLHWKIQTVDTEENSVSGNTAIAMDASGNPHIVYIASEETGTVRYVWQDGALWVNETVIANIGTDIEVFLILDALQQPHIGFRFYDGSNMSVLYAHKVLAQP